MSGKHKHPGATGVAPPNLVKLTPRQRRKLRDWIRGWNLAQVDEQAFVEDVANAIWLYPSLKQLADASSAGSMRRNLDAAIRAGHKFVATLDRLDGNSLFYLSMQTRGRSIKQEAHGILHALHAARQIAERFPKRGPRPELEKVQFASLLRRALCRHTSARPTSTSGGLFETLLCYAFALAGEKFESLHGLAARTLAADLRIEETGAVLSIPSPEQPE